MWLGIKFDASLSVGIRRLADTMAEEIMGFNRCRPARDKYDDK